MPINPSRSPKRSGTSNGSPHPNRHDQRLQRRRRRQPHSTALHPLRNGVPFECGEVVGVYSVWTATPLDGPCVVTNWSDILDVLRAPQLRVWKRRTSNVRPTGRFRGGFAIAGNSMLTTSPLLDTTDQMKRIDRLWTSFIPSASFLLKPSDIADGFDQVSAQGDVSLPGRRPSTAYHRPHHLHTIV